MSTRTFFRDCACGESFDDSRGNRCPSCKEFHDGLRRLVNVGASRHQCDSRCVHARGLTCNCACNGKNHGVGSVTLCPHGLPLAENVCGPCSQGRPNKAPLGFGIPVLRDMVRERMRGGLTQEDAIAAVAEYGELRSEAIEALRSAVSA